MFNHKNHKQRREQDKPCPNDPTKHANGKRFNFSRERTISIQ